MEAQTKKTQQLFCLNELSKEMDINIFNDIIFGEKIILFTNYDYNFYKICKNRYGKPRNNFTIDHIDIIFETEVIIITITAEFILYKF
jgi:hypothetical protein